MLYFATLSGKIGQNIIKINAILLEHTNYSYKIPKTYMCFAFPRTFTQKDATLVQEIEKKHLFSRNCTKALEMLHKPGLRAWRQIASML